MSSDKNILIVANGEKANRELILQRAHLAEYIIAADGGINACMQFMIKPDCLIGDLDSYDHSSRKEMPDIKILRISDQNTTDMQKALNYACSLNPTRIDVIGAFGKRVDHTIGNILILHGYTADIPLFMHENFGSLSVIFPGTTQLSNSIGNTISLFALQPVNNLRLQGFEFPLENPRIEPGFIGVSNKVNRSDAVISFDDGRLLMYRLRHEG